MSDSEKINWKRIGVEATAIVASILLAFAIDAWWDNRKESVSQVAQLQSLVRELDDAQGHLTSQKQSLENALAGTVRILELMGPEAGADEGQAFPDALANSFNIGVSLPQRGVLSEILASRASAHSRVNDVWSDLQSFSTALDDMAVDGVHLESNREQDFIAALVRLDVSMSSVIKLQFGATSADSSFQIPESKFAPQWTTLLRDPALETIFVMRALRINLLLIIHEEAIETAARVIEQLDSPQ